MSRFAALATVLSITALTALPAYAAEDEPSVPVTTTVPAVETTTVPPVATTTVESATPAEPVVTTTTTAPAVVTSTTAPETGKVAGVVWGDKNGNGSYEDGEGFAKVEVQLSGANSNLSKSTKTDAGGHFVFGNVPFGDYHIRHLRTQEGWDYDLKTPVVTVDGSDKSENLRLKAIKGLAAILAADIKFAKDTYQPGETAHLTVTLTNNGSAPLTGIQGSCNRVGDENQIQSGPGWGPLDPMGPGDTIAAGQTKTYDVTSVVPANAANYGHLIAACDFGPNVNMEAPGPVAVDIARVPGKTGVTFGFLYQDKNDNEQLDDGEALAGVRIGLADIQTGKIVAKATTDSAGRWDAKDIPTGIYDVHVFGPWQFVREDNPAFVQADFCYWCGSEYQVVPGPDNPETEDVVPNPITTPPVPPTTTPAAPTTTPAPQAAAATSLSYTGASVIGISLVGLVVLGSGCGFVLMSRRRKASRVS
jgi:uncharacterized surface anchored protein